MKEEIFFPISIVDTDSNHFGLSDVMESQRYQYIDRTRCGKAFLWFITDTPKT